MGIHGLAKVIGDYAPSAVKENEIKNYFGKCKYIVTWLNYAGEHCDACKSAMTVIMGSDAAVKSCIERLTMSYSIQIK